MRFKLPKKAFEELKELVKRRDRELAYIYKKYIEEDPPYQNIEIHHHKHVGNFGAMPRTVMGNKKRSRPESRRLSDMRRRQNMERKT